MIMLYSARRAAQRATFPDLVVWIHCKLELFVKTLKVHPFKKQSNFSNFVHYGIHLPFMLRLSPLSIIQTMRDRRRMSGNPSNVSGRVTGISIVVKCF